MADDTSDYEPPEAYDCSICGGAKTVEPWSGECSAHTPLVNCHCGASYPLVHRETFWPGTPDVMYLPNGDPGYPGEPPEFYCPECETCETCEDPQEPTEVY